MGRKSLGSKDRRILKQAVEIVGIDEVGRGSLAGPVVVCGLVFRRIPVNSAVRDSKRMSRRQREEAAAWILDRCDRWLISEAWVELIDRVNILEATRLAIRATALALRTSASVVVVDHVDPGDVGCPTVATAGADADYFCVAASSIVAKVHRDQLMTRLADRYGEWQWARNKGYGTVGHREALGRFGRSYLHRKSFGCSPVLP